MSGGRPIYGFGLPCFLVDDDDNDDGDDDDDDDHDDDDDDVDILEQLSWQWALVSAKGSNTKNI